MMKKTMLMAVAAVLLLSLQTVAGERLTLKDITSGEYRGESMAAVQALADGESYAQMSDDGKRIERYSFQTGKLSGTLFNADEAEGDTLPSLDGYIMSPDGKYMLIQTNTKRIYRHSFTATYYIYNIGTHALMPLSKNGPQQTPLFSPDGNQIAFVRDNNIFLIQLLNDNAEV